MALPLFFTSQKIMKITKVYRSVSYINMIMTYFKKSPEGAILEEKSIEFVGGTKHPVFLGGAYKTSDKDIQDYLEGRGDFNIEFKLDRMYNTETGEPIKPGEITKPTPEEKEVAIDAVEKEEEIELTEIPDITTVQQASAYLRANYEGITARDVNTKPGVLSKAKELKLIFTDLN